MLNFLFIIVSLLRKCYWFLLRPVTIGVKIMAISNGKILLVKNRYEKMWYMPGGAVKNGETLIESAEREIKEECGVTPRNVRIFSVYTNFSEYKSDHIIVVRADIDELIPNKGLEIEELGFFNMENLPENVSPATKRRVNEYLSGEINTAKW